MRIRAFVAALALSTSARAQNHAPSSSATDGAAIVAATWEVMMYDHVDIRDGEWILNAAGLDAGAVARQLALVLRDPAPSVGVQAAGFLSRIGPKAAEAVSALSDGVLDASNSDLRWVCALALGRIGAAALAATSPLIFALKDEDPVVRAAAAVALGRIGNDSALVRQALSAASQDPDAEVRYAAQKALGSTRFPAPPAERPS